MTAFTMLGASSPNDRSCLQACNHQDENTLRLPWPIFSFDARVINSLWSLTMGDLQAEKNVADQHLQFL
jgi:hypothetical protein